MDPRSPNLEDRYKALDSKEEITPREIWIKNWNSLHNFLRERSKSNLRIYGMYERLFKQMDLFASNNDYKLDNLKRDLSVIIESPDIDSKLKKTTEDILNNIENSEFISAIRDNYQERAVEGEDSIYNEIKEGKKLFQQEILRPKSASVQQEILRSESASDVKNLQINDVEIELGKLFIQTKSNLEDALKKILSIKDVEDVNNLNQEVIKLIEEFYGTIKSHSKSLNKNSFDALHKRADDFVNNFALAMKNLTIKKANEPSDQSLFIATLISIFRIRESLQEQGLKSPPEMNSSLVTSYLYLSILFLTNQKKLKKDDIYLYAEYLNHEKMLALLENSDFHKNFSSKNELFDLLKNTDNAIIKEYGNRVAILTTLAIELAKIELAKINLDDKDLNSAINLLERTKVQIINPEYNKGMPNPNKIVFLELLRSTYEKRLEMTQASQKQENFKDEKNAKDEVAEDSDESSIYEITKLIIIECMTRAIQAYLRKDEEETKINLDNIIEEINLHEDEWLSDKDEATERLKDRLGNLLEKVYPSTKVSSQNESDEDVEEITDDELTDDESKHKKGKKRSIFADPDDHDIVSKKQKPNKDEYSDDEDEKRVSNKSPPIQ